jgi:hypothetical protein
VNLPFGPALRQPDQRSCGPSCLVVARMLRDPAYATLTSHDFGAEVLATHRRVTGSRPAAGALQLPWPRALGTPPWAVARELARLTGTTYRWPLVRGRAGSVPERVLAGLELGLPVVTYVGSTWLPRHVLLAVRADDDGRPEYYDPARGELVPASARWSVPWFVVAPLT